MLTAGRTRRPGQERGHPASAARRWWRKRSAPASQNYDEPHPKLYAIDRYEEIRPALDAIERSGTGEKADIISALFDTTNRQSVPGTYSIEENGDSTLTDYGIYRVRDGELVFDRTIQAATG